MLEKTSGSCAAMFGVGDWIRTWKDMCQPGNSTLCIKELQEREPQSKPPLKKLTALDRPVSCSHREAAELFYSDRERGSDRSAGMMLDKLAALGLISKEFDGNITRIEILCIVE